MEHGLRWVQGEAEANGSLGSRERLGREQLHVSEEGEAGPKDLEAGADKWKHRV